MAVYYSVIALLTPAVTAGRLLCLMKSPEPSRTVLLSKRRQYCVCQKGRKESPTMEYRFNGFFLQFYFQGSSLMIYS